MVKPTALSKLAFFASIFALVVIALGAFTRLIDAGLGCPDWPGCYGHLIAPLQQLANIQYPQTPLVSYKAWAEMIHRYFVSGLSLLIIGMVILTAKKQFRTRGNIVLAGCIILLLIYQIILGRWTVTLKLLPIIVTQHLLGGFLILSVLWLLYLNNRHDDFGRRGLTSLSSLFYLSLGAIVILLFQISLGAWTSTNYASLSCHDFPFCNNQHPLSALYLREAFNLFSPVGINYEGGVLPIVIRQTIQVVHRIGALIFTLYIFMFAAFAIQKLKKYPELLKPLYIILGLVMIQLCVGMVNVIFKLPLISALAHNLLAALLLLAILTFTFKLKAASS